MFANAMVAAIDAARTLDASSITYQQTFGRRGEPARSATRRSSSPCSSKPAGRRYAAIIKPVGIPPGRPSIFPPRRPQRAPVRAVAIARRRHLAASGPMPPALACQVHGRRAGRAADRRRRGPRRRAVCASASTRSRPGQGCAGGWLRTPFGRRPALGCSRSRSGGARARRTCPTSSGWSAANGWRGCG